MAFDGLYSTELDIEGEGDTDLEEIFGQLKHRTEYGVDRTDEGLRVRAHGIELNLYEEGFEAEVAPSIRGYDDAAKLAMYLSAQYKTDVSGLLESGMSGGG